MNTKSDQFITVIIDVWGFANFLQRFYSIFADAKMTSQLDMELNLNCILKIVHISRYLSSIWMNSIYSYLAIACFSIISSICFHPVFYQRHKNNNRNIGIEVTALSWLLSENKEWLFTLSCRLFNSLDLWIL